MGQGDDFYNFMMEITKFDPKNYGLREPNVNMKAFSHYVEDYLSMGKIERETKKNANNLRRTVATFMSIVQNRIAEKIDEQNECVLVAMFHKFDTDRSGDMDLVELRKMLTFYSKDGRTVPSVLETKQLMQLIDEDKSHRLEEKEWVLLMMYGLNQSYADRKKLAGSSSLHRKLNNFTFAIINGINRFLTNLHELWSMYDRNHVGFLTANRVGDMLQRAYKNVYKQTKQLGEPPATPKQPPSDEDVHLFIGVINSTCDGKHHAHDQDGNRLLTEDAFTLFMLQGLRDAENVEEKGLRNRKVKAVYTWRHKMVKMLMWQE